MQQADRPLRHDHATRSPDGIDRDLSVLKTINAELGGNLGIGGLVATAGSVAVGDEIARLG